jgi:membrane dipeptidase
MFNSMTFSTRPLSFFRPITTALLVCLAVLAGQGALADVGADSDSDANQKKLEERVDRILKKTPLIDGHNDLPWGYWRRVEGRINAMPMDDDLTGFEPPTHTDLDRLRKGRVGGQFWSVYTPIKAYPGESGEASRVLRQMDLVYRLIERHPSDLELALTAADIRRIHRSGKIASMMGIEGGHAIENSLATLRMLYRAGARYMTLTHGKGLRWADSATDESRVGGLTEFGVAVVKEMNRLGMLVDLSHVSVETMFDALDATAAPVIYSHSSAFSVTRHPRNVPDEVLLKVKENGGVVMVTFFPTYVSEPLRIAFNALKETVNQETDDPIERQKLMKERSVNLPRPTLSQVADHIDHIRALIGVEHIGLGGDYDGMPPGPIGLEDVSTYPALFVELLRRGYSDRDIAAIAGDNVLRVMSQAEKVAKKLQKTTTPDDRLID